MQTVTCECQELNSTLNPDFALISPKFPPTLHRLDTGTLYPGIISSPSYPIWQWAQMGSVGVLFFFFFLVWVLVKITALFSNASNQSFFKTCTCCSSSSSSSSSITRHGPSTERRFLRVLVHVQAYSCTIPDPIHRYLSSRARFKAALTITHIEQQDTRITPR